MKCYGSRINNWKKRVVRDRVSGWITRLLFIPKSVHHKPRHYQEVHLCICFAYSNVSLFFAFSLPSSSTCWRGCRWACLGFFTLIRLSCDIMELLQHALQVVSLLYLAFSSSAYAKPVILKRGDQSSSWVLAPLKWFIQLSTHRGGYPYHLDWMKAQEAWLYQLFQSSIDRSGTFLGGGSLASGVEIRKFALWTRVTHWPDTKLPDSGVYAEGWGSGWRRAC